MIAPETDDKPVPAQLFDVQVRVGQRQCDERRINEACGYLLGKMSRVSVSGPDWTRGQDLLMQVAEAPKETLIDQGRGTEPHRADQAAVNRNQGVDHLVPSLQQETRQRDESNSCVGWADTPVLHLSIEPNGGIFLEPPRLHGEIWLNRMEFFRSSAESLFLQDGK
jgi:hypothetical protein